MLRAYVGLTRRSGLVRQFLARRFFERLQRQVQFHRVLFGGALRFYGRGPRRNAGWGHVHLGKSLRIAQRFEAAGQERAQLNTPARAVVEAHLQFIVLRGDNAEIRDVKNSHRDANPVEPRTLGHRMSTKGKGRKDLHSDLRTSRPRCRKTTVRLPWSAVQVREDLLTPPGAARLRSSAGCRWLDGGVFKNPTESQNGNRIGGGSSSRLANGHRRWRAGISAEGRS